MYFQKRQRKKGIVWTVYIDYKDIYGRKQTYSKGGFKTKKDAQKHGFEKQNELNKGIDIKGKKYTLNELFDEYMDVIGNTKLSTNSITAYHSLYDNHVRDSIGKCNIDSLRFGDLQKYFNCIHRSSQTCNTIKAILSSVYSYAMKNGCIETNPIREIEIIRSEQKRDVKSITFEEFTRIIEYTLKPNKRGEIPFSKRSYACSFYIGYFLGLRISEALALNKSDFDFDKDTVKINKQLVHDGLKREKYYTTNQMKTKTSKAVLPLPEPLKIVLMQWFKENPYEIVCPDENGLYINPRIVDGYIRGMRKKLHLSKDFCFHSFRHSCASNLVKSGVDVATASKILRHANITTTLDVYTDAKQEDMKGAIEMAFNTDFYKKPNQNLTKTKMNALN